MSGHMEYKPTMAIRIIILAVFFFQLVLSNTTYEPCGEIDHLNESYGIVKLDIDHCQNQEDCSITTGKNLNIKSLAFVPKVDSESVNLKVLVGSDGADNPVQLQMSGLPENGNLCKMTESFKMQDNKCHVSRNQKYLLLDYKFFIPRLMPTGNVNLTFLLTGDDDLLSCALVRANFID